MRKIWLVTTEHLEDELWFRDEEDFKVGMNYVAVEAGCNPAVKILSFILMSNHVHFVLRGSRKEALQFIRRFKQRYSMFYAKRWGVRKFLRLNGIDIQEVTGLEEAAERAIAYVQMNCVAANICSHPSQYPWGTGNVYFNPTKPAGVCLKDLSARTRERILHSNCDHLPGDWHIGPDGYILPQEYVDVEAVEALFRTPKRLNYFLTTSSKARKRLEAGTALPAFRDQTILASVTDLCQSLFQKGSFRELAPEEKMEFMRQIRFRFSADINQIARVCGLSYAEAAKLIDSV